MRDEMDNRKVIRKTECRFHERDKYEFSIDVVFEKYEEQKVCLH